MNVCTVSVFSPDFESSARKVTIRWLMWSWRPFMVGHTQRRMLCTALCASVVSWKQNSVFIFPRTTSKIWKLPLKKLFHLFKAYWPPQLLVYLKVKHTLRGSLMVYDLVLNHRNPRMWFLKKIALKAKSVYVNTWGRYEGVIKLFLVREFSVQEIDF